MRAIHISQDERPPVPRRFTTLRCIDGWEVIDADGRKVDRRDTKRQANGVAQRLNNAAAAGALESAFGA